MTYPGSLPLIQQPGPLDAVANALREFGALRQQWEEQEQAQQDRALRRELTQAQIAHTRAQTGAVTEQAKEPQRRRMAEAEQTAERNKALQQALGGIEDPKVRTGLGMILSLGEDVPADVRTALYQTFVGDQNPSQGMRLFLQHLRAGISAGNAARAAGIDLPSGYTENYTIPNALSVYAADRRRQQEISNLNNQATRLSQYIAGADRAAETARDNATRRIAGPRAAYNALTPEERARVDEQVARFVRGRYPDLEVRRAEHQRVLTQFGTLTGVQVPGQPGVPGLNAIVDQDFDDNP